MSMIGRRNQHHVFIPSFFYEPGNAFCFCKSAKKFLFYAYGVNTFLWNSEFFKFQDRPFIVRQVSSKQTGELCFSRPTENQYFFTSHLIIEGSSPIKFEFETTWRAAQDVNRIDHI